MNETDRGRYTRIGNEVYASTPGNRVYAQSSELPTAIGVLAAAYHANGGSLDNDNRKKFGEVLLRLKPAISGLFKDQPGDAKPLPKPWLNPVTNQPLPPPKTMGEKTLLRKHDPDLATHYEEMERDPYAYIQKLRDAEAKRVMLAAIPYGPAEHKNNVFRGNDQTAIAQFIKRDPELAKYYQGEAKSADIPLFGQNRNLTIEGRLARDPDTWALIKIAQGIHQQWREQDRMAAEEQRKAAELALEKLKESDAKPVPRSMATIGA
jgi:hypothetical protein